jgi:drug/metabolite transporter (DMT)-like permease
VRQPLAEIPPASVVVPYQYSMLVWAVIFGYVVFADVPQISTIIGAVIIIAAGFYIFIREQQLGREPQDLGPQV